MRPLSNFEWVALARSEDEGRPMLMGVHVQGDQLVATDGHPLHIAPRDGCGLPDGTWDVASLAPVDLGGKFPTWEQAIPEGQPKRLITDVRTVRSHCKGAIAAGYEHYVSLPTEDGERMVLDASYLRQALAGAKNGEGKWEWVEVFAGGPYEPLKILIPGFRIAVVMPAKPAELLEGSERPFPRSLLIPQLDVFIEPLPAAEPAPVGE